jgi:DNA-directed RNA polymerase II subunit RPB7
MFFLLNMERIVTLPPQHFGSQLRETLRKQLVREVEGTCSGKHGYIVCVTSILDSGKGRVQVATGKATFRMKYQCVAFRPFKGEVVDCVVSQINKMGFFADAGPFAIFVSSNLIPEDYEFTSGDQGPSFISGDQDVAIVRNCEVRVRIVGTRVDATEIFGIGTIKEDYLGVLGGPDN